MKKIIVFLFISIAILLSKQLYAAEYELKGAIAYSCLTDGYWQIWLKDFNANSETQLTSSKIDKKNPIWSPDGKQIIYRTSNGELFIIDRQGLQERRILDKLGYLSDPNWLPNTNRLLFVRFRSDLKDDSDIWTANLKGEEVIVLNDALGLQYHPNISSDGKKIVYVSGTKPKAHEIWIMDNAGKNRQQLTQNACYNMYPRWSADDKDIVFVSNRTGNYEIWVMQANGTRQKQLTHTGRFNNSPAWSPDGRKIAFVSNTEGSLQIWAMDKDGKNLIRLIRGAECCDPDWHF